MIGMTNMTRMVNCQLLEKELPGLEFQTFPGELGKKIFDNFSAQAWPDWLSPQTMLITEHRLSPINPEHRKFLEAEMEKFFFRGGSEKPEGYVPE
jgi:Fe-S cluster biosynthesis and repair protein YggX